jgi:hypothetical protein
MQNTLKPIQGKAIWLLEAMDGPTKVYNVVYVERNVKY